MGRNQSRPICFPILGLIIIIRRSTRPSPGKSKSCFSLSLALMKMHEEDLGQNNLFFRPTPPLLSLLSHCSSDFFGSTQDFGQLVILSFASVSAAAILYTIYMYRVRKHLFHFDKLCSNICLQGHF